MGRRARRQQAGKSKGLLPNFGKPGPAYRLSQAEVARTSKPGRRSGADAVPFGALSSGLAASCRCRLPAKTRFSRGAAKSRKARTLIGRNRSATYKRLIGIAGGWNSSSTVVNAPSSGRSRELISKGDGNSEAGAGCGISRFRAADDQPRIHRHRYGRLVSDDCPDIG